MSKDKVIDPEQFSLGMSKAISLELNKSKTYGSLLEEYEFRFRGVPVRSYVPVSFPDEYSWETLVASCSVAGSSLEVKFKVQVGFARKIEAWKALVTTLRTYDRLFGHEVEIGNGVEISPLDKPNFAVLRNQALAILSHEVDESLWFNGHQIADPHRTQPPCFLSVELFSSDSAGSWLQQFYALKQLGMVFYTAPHGSNVMLTCNRTVTNPCPHPWEVLPSQVSELALYQACRRLAISALTQEFDANFRFRDRLVSQIGSL